MTRLLSLLVVAVIVPLGSGCSPPPSVRPSDIGSTPRAPAAPSASLRSISISGNLALESLGETSQLIVTATFSDGTTRDVTGGVTWNAPDARVVTVSQSGLVMATGFGSTTIRCEWNAAYSTKTVTVTTRGTFAIGGIVSEPTDSDFLEFFGGLPNVRVLDTLSGQFTTTDALGKFTFALLPSPMAHLRLEKGGYETAEVEVDLNAMNVDYVELPLQPVVRLVAGETVTPAALVPNDLSYEVGGRRCFPCRLIRVVVPRAGTVRVRVSWSPSTSLALFAEGQVVEGGPAELSVDLPFNGPREVVMYFGGTSPTSVRGWTPFTFETSVR